MSGFPPPSHVALASVRRELGQSADREQTGSRITSLEHRLLSHAAGLVGYGRHDVGGIFSLSHPLVQWYGCRLATGISLAPAKRHESRVLVSTGNVDLLHPGQPLFGIKGIDTTLIPANTEGNLELDRLCSFLENCYRRGVHVDGILLTQGQKCTGASDPVAEVQRETTRLRQTYGVLKRPHIHLDIPLHWPFLLFGEYDTTRNPLDLSLDTIRPLMSSAADAAASDSCSIDLGNWGYTPLPLSLLIVKNYKNLMPLLPDAAVPRLDGATPGVIPQAESSSTDLARLCSLQALHASLSQLGEDGLRLLAARSIENASYLKERLRESGHVGILHPASIGPGVAFRRYHPDLGHRAGEILRAEIQAARRGDTAPLLANSRWHQRQFARQGIRGVRAAWQPAAAHFVNEPAQHAEPVAAEVATMLHPRLTAAHIDLFVQGLPGQRQVAEPAPDY
ncbi:hypothetical protein [Microbulbifer halophilus]|uniref:hypothetical protein n=1 Tax=Microbulbifer halophilus TaxID=453963 RepID=UPI003620E818